MCRLGLFNKQGLTKLGRDGLQIFLDHLEKECGGHGNGIALIDNVEGENKCTLIHKAISFKNEQIVEIVYNDIPEWLIYHTRVASKGSIKDTNCHPYRNEDMSFVLAMNGTVGAFGDLAKSLDITDTELIFKNLDAFNIPENNLIELTPKFIGFRDGKVFATNPDCNTGLEYDDEDGIIIASSFPKEYGGNNRDMETYYVWHEGEEIKELVKKVPTSSYSYYGTEDYNWGWYQNYYRKQQTQDKKNEEQVEEKVEEEKEYYSELELMDIVDEANQLIKEGMTGEDVKVYIEEYLGNLEPATPYGKFTISCTDKQVVMKDELGEIYY